MQKRICPTQQEGGSMMKTHRGLRFVVLVALLACAGLTTSLGLAGNASAVPTFTYVSTDVTATCDGTTGTITATDSYTASDTDRGTHAIWLDGTDTSLLIQFQTVAGAHSDSQTYPNVAAGTHKVEFLDPNGVEVDKTVVVCPTSTQTPTPTPTITPTPTDTGTPTATATPTVTHTQTDTVPPTKSTPVVARPTYTIQPPSAGAQTGRTGVPTWELVTFVVSLLGLFSLIGFRTRKRWTPAIAGMFGRQR